MDAVRSLTVIGLVCLSGSCGSSESSTPATTDDSVTDVRVAVPAADPTFVDFVTPDITIAAGKEQMHCIHFKYDGPDMAISNAMSLQGKFGHHAILLEAREPKAPGTVEECTESKAMSKYGAFTIPVELPAGHGTFVKGGKNMVLQTHYVNTTRKAIKVRDVVRLKKIEIADVKTWTAVLATSAMKMTIPAKQSSSFSFDCPVEKDFKLLLLGGHMHEYGTKIEIGLGPTADAVKPVHTVSDWKVEYRDAPPIEMMISNPISVTAGTIIRTTCTWNNTTDHAMDFPEEMCASFGFAAGVKDPIECRRPL